MLGFPPDFLGLEMIYLEEHESEVKYFLLQELCAILIPKVLQSYRVPFRKDRNG